MAIKRFTAATWEEALRQMKAEYGDDAIILHSKTYKDGGVLGLGNRPVVEITATNDKNLATAARPEAEPPAGDESASGSRQNIARLLEKAYAVASAKAEEEAARAGAPAASEAQRARLAIGQAPAATAQPQPVKAALFKSSKMATRPSGESNPDISVIMRELSELKDLVSRFRQGPDAVMLAELSGPMQAIHQRLLDHDVPADLARGIVQQVARELTGPALDDAAQVEQAAVRLIAAMLPIAEPLHLSNTKTTVVALIGPTGVGKTTTLVKLATNLMIRERHRKVGIITLDVYRLGATEQLKAFGSIINVPVRVVMSPGEVRSAIREMGNLDAIFIDTAGRSQHDRMKMNELKTFLDAATPDETYLCVSATTHPAHLMSILDHFGSVSADRLILTKLDEAATFGPVFEVAMKSGQPVSYMTTGQNVPDDIELASGERLARLMLGLDVVE